MPPPRFVADAMLGSLARWLRVLDVDVHYDPHLDDAELVDLAVAEGRTILTRDRRLVLRRRARDHLFVDHDDLPSQLRQVVTEAGIRLRRDALFGRCLRCNRPLHDLPAEQAATRVPPFVARTQRKFRCCPACGRVYWRATHVERMVERIRAMGVELA